MKHLLITIAAVVLVGCGPSVGIHQAVGNGNIEAVKQYLAAGGDVNAKDDDGWTPLHHAAIWSHKEIAELLIAEGADVNAKDQKEERAPLHMAAYWGENDIVELLIAEGADVNAKDEDGKTPLDLATNETADLLRKHGGKTKNELEAAGN